MTTAARRSLQLFALVLALASASAAQPVDGPLGAPAARPQPSPTERVARRFYDAFVSGDVKGVERLYHPQVKFKDEIFSFSDREGTVGMWRVLLGPDAGARFTYEFLSADGEVANVLWKADYKLFGRPIHNEITARLVIRDGLIVEHRDSFSWEKWSRQAFPLGRVSTWRPIEHTLKFVMRTALGFQARAAAKKAAEAEAAAAAQAPRPAAAPSRGIATVLDRKLD